MGRDDLSYLDQLEEWLEAQVPGNLHDLPFKMLETVERVSTELFESLNIHGPPSISLPFPPFKEQAPPPPPPPAAPLSALTSALGRVRQLARDRPAALASGAALAAVGLGLGVAMARRGLGSSARRGAVQDGMLAEAIVILAPSPSPPLLVPLAATLLKAGYVVIVAVPHTKDADGLERRLSGLDEKGALRVLIYDPDDYTTFPPFHRSLQATLSLRYPAYGSAAGAAVTPHVHAYLSLYPLHPSPPSHPGGLPALPALFAADGPGTSRARPLLVTLYPAASVLTVPDQFGTQALRATHALLARNLAASAGARTVSLFIGDVALPTLPALISAARPGSRREAARAQLRASATAAGKAGALGAYVAGSLRALWAGLAARLGLGAHARDYAAFERHVLDLLKPGVLGAARALLGRDETHHVGAHSYLARALARLPVPVARRALAVLPAIPPTGPAAPSPARSLDAGASTGKRAAAGVGAAGATGPAGPASAASAPASASSSDHEAGDDLASSIHTGTSASSAGLSAASAGTGASGASEAGLDGSWVGLDAGGQ